MLETRGGIVGQTFAVFFCFSENIFRPESVWQKQALMARAHVSQLLTVTRGNKSSYIGHFILKGTEGGEWNTAQTGHVLNERRDG